MDDIQGVGEDHGREGGGSGGREGKLTRDHGTTWNTSMGRRIMRSGKSGRKRRF
jgi:hypothetical protein